MATVKLEPDDIEPDFIDEIYEPLEEKEFEVISKELSKLVVTERRICTYIPRVSRRGKEKIPESWPDWRSKAIQYVLWGPPAIIKNVYSIMRMKQQEFWSKIKVFKGHLCQGEFSEPEKGSKPHIQGVIYGKSSITSKQMWYVLHHYMIRPDALQITPCNSLKDAWHYCSKPHNMCECDNCKKCRLCKPNWADVIWSGVEPVGRGKNRFKAFEDAMKIKPSKKIMFEEFGNLYSRYGNNINNIRKYYHSKMQMCNYRVEHQIAAITPFQMALVIQQVYCPPKPYHFNRNISWWWSYTIGTGKTAMADFMKYLVGLDDCINAMDSIKHTINTYTDEKFVFFNAPKGMRENSKEFRIFCCNIENLDDGGFRQAAMYESDKKVIRCKVVVTANLPPPVCWQNPDGGRCVDQCLNFDDPDYVRPMEQEDSLTDYGSEDEYDQTYPA